jgi:hypothetical protein
MLKKTIVIGVLLLAAGCSGPAKSLRVISEAQRSKKVSYTAKDLIIRALYASYIGDTLIERNYVAPVSEIQQIADEIRDIDRKFKTRVIQDSAYTKLFVWW